MKQASLRWYQKNEYLNAFLNLFQDLSREEQCEMAIDIIIKASSFLDRDYSKIIQEVASFNPNDYKRWYDKNPNIHIAIETLRDLNDEQKEEIIQEFSAEILNSHSDKLAAYKDIL